MHVAEGPHVSTSGYRTEHREPARLCEARRAAAQPPGLRQPVAGPAVDQVEGPAPGRFVALDIEQRIDRQQPARVARRRGIERAADQIHAEVEPLQMLQDRRLQAHVRQRMAVDRTACG